MIDSRLTTLQTKFLTAFFRHESGFFLTGGAALAGFYLGHRETFDLDLFTLVDEMESGAHLVLQAATEIGASVEALQTSPDFRRYLVKTSDESIVVDLIREYVFQADTQKRNINGVRIDTPEEIFANKLCALLSRSEIRDIIDLRHLERSGLDLDAALEAAAKKDNGFSPSQLAWVLSQITVPETFEPADGSDADDLQAYIQDLAKRLAVKAFPSD